MSDNQTFPSCVTVLHHGISKKRQIVVSVVQREKCPFRGFGDNCQTFPLLVECTSPHNVYVF